MYRFRHQYLGCCLCGAGADRLGPASAAQDPASLSLAMGKERASSCAKGVSLVGTGRWGGGRGEAQNLECLESHAYQRRTSHLDI